MRKLKTLLNRFIRTNVAIVVVASQLTTFAVAFRPAVVSAVPVCTNDQQGANDEPGQKDLTLMCFDNANLPTSVGVSWQWDEISWSGSNTGDACALFDADSDGDANYAFCVVIGGSPASQLAGSPKVYTCNDTRADRCSGKQLVNKVYTSTCSIVTGTDPFSAGASFPSDTRANCSINLSDFSTSQAPSTIVLKDVCSYPSQEPNSDPSDCIKASSSKTTTIELVKKISATSDLGKFNLFIESIQHVTNGGDSSSTGVIAINDRSDITLKETAGTSTSLNDYTTTISCKDQSGQSVDVGSISGTDSRSADIDSSDIDEGDNIVCTFTNTRKQGTLIVNKTLINDNGGTKQKQDFSYQVNGASAVAFEADGSNSQTLPVGTYSITEIEDAAYTTSYSNCTNITVVYNQTTTCTITNNDKPGTLIVNKTLINDNGGTKQKQDFSYQVNGASAVAFEADGSNSQTVNAGTYNVTEVTVAGYQASYNNCSNVVVGNGETATCTITNDDQPGTLIVKKVLTQDNGGSDSVTSFTFMINGGLPISFESDTQNEMTVDAGLYSVVESLTGGKYDTTYNNCSQVTVPNGGSATCTITNNDIAPKLVVTKIVVNNDGGTLSVDDFALSVTNTATQSVVQVTSGVSNNFSAGTYLVSELSNSGYLASDWDGDCSSGGQIILELGGSYSCEVTNDDKPGTLIIKKVVINNNGGTKQVQDFEFKVNDDSYVFFEADGQNAATVSAGIYSIVEKTYSDYTTSYDNCSQLVIPNGGTATCTITNDDKPASLKVKKVLIQDDGGTEGYEDFSFSVNVGSSMSFDEDGVNAITVNAGSYTVVEDQFTGYTTTYDNCEDIVLASGGYAECTITNNDIAPTLTLYKTVTNDDGGSASKNNFEPYIDDKKTSWSTAAVVSAGSYTVSEYMNVDGYQSSGWSGDCDSEGKIEVKIGQNYTCSITNDDIAPVINLRKVTMPVQSEQMFELGITYEGGYEEDDITEEVYVDTSDTTELDNEESFEVNAGWVKVFENVPEGWDLQEISCYHRDSDMVGETYSGTDYEFYASNGDVIDCEFVNVERFDLNVTKFHDVNENGEWDEDEPTLEGWNMLLEQPCFMSLELTRVQNNSCCSYLDERIQLFEVTDDEYPVECEDSSLYDEKLTDEDGVAHFSNLPFGPYMLSEELQDGWKQSAIYCDYRELEISLAELDQRTFLYDDSKLPIRTYPGGDMNCYVGNHKLPKMNLTKSNNAPLPKLRGETVTYTLTVNVPDANSSGRVYDSNGNYQGYEFSAVECEECEESEYEAVSVVDLPPAGFTYLAGSWTANSNIRGDLKAQGITTEPTYASPGKWSLTNLDSGFLSPGEIITLTYKAVIGSSVATATHPDTAFASGFSANGSTAVFANSATNPFVGTKVSIQDPVKSTGFVLGTSTLVDTGRSIKLQLFFGAGLLLAVIALSKRQKRVNGKLIALVVSGVSGVALFVSFAGNVSAVSMATIQLPNTTTATKSFNVGYTLQSTDEDEDFQVKLYINGVESGTQSTVKSYGDSGQFPVVLPSDGVYTFKIIGTVVAGTSIGETAESETVSTTVDTVVPANPTFGGVSRVGDAHTLSFTIPAGSDATKVAVYASTAKSFQLDSTTRIATIDATPGVQQTYTYNAPTSETYYFALTGVDNAGNASTAVGDADVVTIEATNTRSNTAQQNTAGEVQGEQSGVDPNKVNQPFAEEASDDSNKQDSSNTALITALVIGALIVGTAVYRRMQSDKAEADLTQKEKKSNSKKK